MMGRQDWDQRQLFYEFSLDEMIPTDHLLRRINVFVTAVLADLHEQLKAFYSDIGRPSVDPELMMSRSKSPMVAIFSYFVLPILDTFCSAIVPSDRG
jgi:hypothetical protein